MTDNTHAVEYTGSARVWRQPAKDRAVSPGDPYLTGLSETDANELVESGAFEHADDADTATDESATAAGEADTTDADTPDTSDTDEDEPTAPEPLDGTVAELDDALESGEYDDDLVDLYNAEKNHEDRSTAIDAIQLRRKHLRDINQADSDGNEG